jgi:hypothetical protein
MGTPDPPDPPPLPPPPIVNDEAEESELARQRRSLEIKRTGRSDLRNDPPAEAPTGIRIPRA